MKGNWTIWATKPRFCVGVLLLSIGILVVSPAFSQERKAVDVDPFDGTVCEYEEVFVSLDTDGGIFGDENIQFWFVSKEKDAEMPGIEVPGTPWKLMVLVRERQREVHSSIQQHSLVEMIEITREMEEDAGSYASIPSVGGGCFTVVPKLLRVCYTYAKRPDGTWAVTVLLYTWNNETQTWVRVLKLKVTLDFGWLEENGPSEGGPQTVGEFFNLIREVMEEDLPGANLDDLFRELKEELKKLNIWFDQDLDDIDQAHETLLI